MSVSSNGSVVVKGHTVSDDVSCQRFNAATKLVASLPQHGSFTPSNELKLKLYGLFKQATVGPCNSSRPGFWDPVNRAKWDSWHSFQNMSTADAMNEYVDALKPILETMTLDDNAQEFLQTIEPFYVFVDSSGRPSKQYYGCSNGHVFPDDSADKPLEVITDYALNCSEFASTHKSTEDSGFDDEDSWKGTPPASRLHNNGVDLDTINESDVHTGPQVNGFLTHEKRSTTRTPSSRSLVEISSETEEDLYMDASEKAEGMEQVVTSSSTTSVLFSSNNSVSNGHLPKSVHHNLSQAQLCTNEGKKMSGRRTLNKEIEKDKKKSVKITTNCSAVVNSNGSLEPQTNVVGRPTLSFPASVLSLFADSFMPDTLPIREPQKRSLSVLNNSVHHQDAVLLRLGTSIAELQGAQEKSTKRERMRNRLLQRIVNGESKGKSPRKSRGRDQDQIGSRPTGSSGGAGNVVSNIPLSDSLPPAGGGLAQLSEIETHHSSGGGSGSGSGGSSRDSSSSRGSTDRQMSAVLYRMHRDLQGISRQLELMQAILTTQQSLIGRMLSQMSQISPVGFGQLKWRTLIFFIMWPVLVHFLIRYFHGRFPMYQRRLHRF